MTTATDTDQDATLYGPDGRPLSRPATEPAQRTPRPTAQSGDWQPITTHGNATVWEKSPQPAPAAEPTETAALRAALDSQQARVAELEKRLAIEAAKDRQPAPVAETTKPARTSGLVDRLGPKVALVAAVGLTASGEYELAHLVGFPGLIAALLPTAIDVYVVQAMRRHRDVLVALLLMVATNALFHLAEAGLFGVTPGGDATWWLIVSVAAIAPFIVWRVHRITETKQTAPQAAKEEPSVLADRTAQRSTTTADRTGSTIATTLDRTADRPETAVDRTASAPGGPDREELMDRTADQQPVDRRSTTGPDRTARTRVDRTADRPSEAVVDRPKQSAQTAARSTTGPDQTAVQPLTLNDIEQTAVDRLRSTGRSISKRSIAEVVRTELDRSIASDRAAEIARHYRTLRSA